MRIRKKLFSAVLAAGLVVSFTSVSNATNGYYMIGTGAKDLGMAGAVIANPQDASTILQNPAGIAWLVGSTVDIGGALFSPTRKYNGTNSDSNYFVIPSAGLAVNSLGCNCDTPHFVFGVGMYGTSGMGVDWESNNLTKNGWLKKAYSSMQMMEMSIGGAYRFNGHLSVGLAPVFCYQSLQMEFGWKVPDYKNTFGHGIYTNQQMGLPPAGVYTDSLDTANAYGVGFDLGAVYKINEIVQLGFVYKSKRWMQKLEWNTIPGNGLMIRGNKVKMRLDMPRQLGFGLNLRPIRQLRLETDVKWINYHDVMNEPSVTGLAIDKWPFHWKNQWVFSVGAEFYATKALTLRAGVNYAKSPIDDDDLNANIVAPAIVQTHIALGASYKISKNFEVSMAYVHAFEHKQTHKNSSMQDQMMYGPETEIKMYQNTFAAQLTYNF